jgi:hypothetical protein
MPLREYAQALGVVLILIGVVGLASGGRLLLGVLSIVIPKGLAHLFTGSLLGYIGFGQADEGLARTAVAAIGVLYLLVGVLGFVLSTWLGLLFSFGYNAVDNIIHLAVGILSLAVAFGSGRGNTSRA